MLINNITKVYQTLQHQSAQNMIFYFGNRFGLYKYNQNFVRGIFIDTINNHDVLSYILITLFCAF